MLRILTAEGNGDKMVKYFLLLLSLIYSNEFYSQHSNTDLTISNNLFAQYDITESFSINYERRILNTEKVTFNFNIGISHTQPLYNSLAYRWYGLPMGITWVFGKKLSHFETGLGMWYRKSYNPDIFQTNNSEYSFQFRIGYRFQKLEQNGINFRIGIAPSYIFSWDVDYIDSDIGGTWYINFGYSFI